MSKSCFSKILRREIKQSFGRFAAIFAIVVLGVAFLSGLLVATPDMRYTMDNYYDEHNAYDINIKSTSGITQEQLDYLAQHAYVKAVSGAKVMDVLVEDSIGEIYASKLYGYDFSDEMNSLELLSGRLPENENECVVERSDSYIQEIEEGTVLAYSEQNSDYEYADYTYNSKEFTVVGTVANPLYFSKEAESVTVGSGTLGAIIYIPISAYKMDMYTDLFVTLEGAEELEAFSSKYNNFTEDKAKELKADLDERFSDTKWYVLDRSSNISYVSFSENVAKVQSIATIFPVFFFLVAALVALTTMTRMVDEERVQIGTLKALGYSNLKISLKYIQYCGLASVLGCIGGMMTGYQLLPFILWGAYDTTYHLPELEFLFEWRISVFSAVGFLIITLGATLAACARSLRERPAVLMVTMAPKPGKRILLERIGFIWKHLSFLYKASFRNIFRYKKHLFMTMIGIGGCTALILTGIGLSDSLDSITHTQYEEILHYDLTVAGTNMESENGDRQKAEDYISEHEDISDYMRLHSERAVASNGDSKVSLNVYVPENFSELSAFVRLAQRGEDEEFDLTQNSVILTEMAAKLLNVEAGDSLQLTDAQDNVISVTVDAITENYVNGYIYISSDIYPQYSGDDEFWNTYLCITDIAEEKQDEVLDELLKCSGVTSAVFAAQTRQSFDNLAVSINGLIAVLVIAAGALAIIVLYNLTNININERCREIATLKVLGFFPIEVCKYIFREIIMLSCLSALFGLVLGKLLHSFVASEAESAMMMFGRSIHWSSYVWAFVATMVFSLAVDIAMIFKLKKIDMVESLKAAE